MANSVWRPLSRPVDAKGKLVRVPWKPVRFHDLRHTYASLAIRAGMDIRLLADRLGHRDPAFTLRVYAHIFDRYRKSGAIEMMDLLKLEPDEDASKNAPENPENPDLNDTDPLNLPE
jgi:integrase